MNPYLKEKTLAMHFNSLDELRLLCQRFEKLWANSFQTVANIPVGNLVASLNVNQINNSGISSQITPPISDKFYETQVQYPTWPTRASLEGTNYDPNYLQISAIQNDSHMFTELDQNVLNSHMHQLTKMTEIFATSGFDISALNSQQLRNVSTGIKESAGIAEISGIDIKIVQKIPCKCLLRLW